MVAKSPVNVTVVLPVSGPLVPAPVALMLKSPFLASRSNWFSLIQKVPRKPAVDTVAAPLVGGLTLKPAPGGIVGRPAPVRSIPSSCGVRAILKLLREMILKFGIPLAASPGPQPLI